jgi:hypothetical protein
MVVLGVDAHKRTHTVVAVDQLGRKLGERTTGTTSQDHLGLLRWAEKFGQQRLWAVEDCRHLSRRLERDLLGAGERIVRVPTKLMAHARDAARSYGKSDPIDALAVARAALREPQLPVAQLEGPARQVRLLVDHRDNLVAERTRAINRLRWHLHELDPSWQPPARTLWRPKHLQTIGDRLASVDGIVARLARGLWNAAASCPSRSPPSTRSSRSSSTRWRLRCLSCALRDHHRRQDRWRDRRRPPVPIPARLRSTQRDRAAACLVGQPCSAPAQPGRQPAAQRRDPPRRHHPGPLPPGRPRLS